ncbi:FliA/WhiG family RNA polymerase sigma factor [Christensenellaceae bacterium OttesenSCG-928-M15]|nr:FliA/WhiG family RNA polymerase sigma factor [Christensenellaceae bacterium OttesenSCG-928-M15]
MEQSFNEQNIDTDKLWQDYQLNRTIDNKNRIIIHYIPLVNSIVNRMVPVYGPHMSCDDLAGYGVLGLIDAVDKYAPERGIRFEAYAAKRIKGEIIDNIRSQDWASASLRNRIKQIGQAYEALEAKQGAPVDDEAVAEHLGLDVQQVRTALEKSYMFNMIRFETLISSAGDGNVKIEETLSDQDACTPEEELTNKEFANILKEAIDRLSDKERKIITLYYFEELMLKDIADILGVTPARVSQIHSRALLKIRVELERYFNLA